MSAQRPHRRSPRRIVLTGLLTLAAVAAGGTAFATSLTVTSSRLTGWHSAAGCTPATVTLSAAADTYVDQSNANSNFGSATDLKIRAPLLGALGVNLGGDRYTLAQFTLPALELCSVTLAKLRLSASSSGAGRNLEVDRVTSAWTQGAVTWNTKPSTTGTAAVTITSGTGYREWVVTTQVATMYSSGSNNGFMVSDASGLSLLSPEQIYNSDESGTNKPQLVVTYG